MTTTAGPRVATGITGLDDILDGGLPRSSLYVIQGDPGVGKTTLCIQFLLDGVNRGEPCLYITLSESASELRSVAASHGWTLEGLVIHELSAAESLSGQDENTLFHPAEVELGERIEQLIAEVDRVKPTRVVLDSCSELRLLAQTPLRFRRQILALKQHLVIERGCTLVLLDNISAGGDDQVLLQSLAHGVISLSQSLPDFGTERRRLAVLKLRGVRFRGGYHDYVIKTGGLVVFPRLIASEHKTSFPDEILTSGVSQLDTLLGGGLSRGTSTLLMGPAGAGKSAIAMQYMAAAASRGEQSALYLFDESRRNALTRAQALGQGAELASERVLIRQLDPAEVCPGEFAHEVRRLVERSNLRLVIIDSLNGYLQAMPNEHSLIAQMHELLMFLGQQGVVTIMVVAQHGIVSDTVFSPLDVSYLADTVIMLRYFEAAGAIRKAISVIKRRTGQHEDTIRELQLTAHGIRLGAPLREFSGVLTGTPLYSGSTEASGPLLDNA